MSKGYVNKETRISADNVNAPHIMDTGGVTDTVSEHIGEILEDRAETDAETWEFTLNNNTVIRKRVYAYAEI